MTSGTTPYTRQKVKEFLYILPSVIPTTLLFLPVVFLDVPSVPMVDYFLTLLPSDM